MRQKVYDSAPEKLTPLNRVHRRRKASRYIIKLLDEAHVQVNRHSVSQVIPPVCEERLPIAASSVNTFHPDVEESLPMGEWRLGPLLSQLRGDMSQAELARRIGLSRERVSQIERGEPKWPNVEHFNAMAEVFDVPVSRLLRAAGANIQPADIPDDLAWVATQLDEDGQEQLVELGHALLRHHRRQPRKAG